MVHETVTHISFNLLLLRCAHEKSRECMQKVTSMRLIWLHSIMPRLEGRREKRTCARHCALERTLGIGCNNVKLIASSQTIYSIAFRFKLTLDLSRSAHTTYITSLLCAAFFSRVMTDFFSFSIFAYAASAVLCAGAHKTCQSAIHFHFRIDCFHSSNLDSQVKNEPPMWTDDTFTETYKLIHWHNENLWSVVRDLQINDSREKNTQCMHTSKCHKIRLENDFAASRHNNTECIVQLVAHFSGGDSLFFPCTRSNIKRQSGHKKAHQKSTIWRVEHWVGRTYNA